MEDWEEGAAEALERVTGSKLADALHGTIRIVSVTPPAGRMRYKPCQMELILNAEGIEDEQLSTEVILDRRYWPAPGLVLRARISRRKPRMIDVNWDGLPKTSGS